MVGLRRGSHWDVHRGGRGRRRWVDEVEAGDVDEVEGGVGETGFPFPMHRDGRIWVLTVIKAVVLR